MSKLRQLLSYLGRPGITELVFRTGAPAQMLSGTRRHPLTVTPLTVAQLRRFFEGTAVLDALPARGEASSEPRVMQLAGESYRVVVTGSRASFEIQVGPAKDPARHGDSTQKLRALDGESSGTVSIPPRPRPRGDGESSGTYSLHGGESSGTHSLRGNGESSGTHGLRGDGESSGRHSRRRDGESSGTHGLRHDGEASGTHGLRGDGETSGLRSPPSGSSTTPTRREPAATDALVIERNEDLYGGNSEELAPPIPSAGPQPIELPEEFGRAAASTNAPPVRWPTAAASRTPSGGTAPDLPSVPLDSGGPVHSGLQRILADARQRVASDVHIVADEPVRVRQSGALAPQGPTISADEVESMARSLLSGRDAQQLATLGYADLAVELTGAGRLRVNVSRQRTGLKICVRMVASAPPTMEALGLPPEVQGLMTHHQGMVIISGPNGHGKTTTMSALVDLFNANRAVHIITVEDPVEVIHPRKKALVTQREVGAHTQSFQTALEAALREDPDVIAIGELRDRETTEMALSASETGHLVLATMSTPSGAKTIDRVIDMFPPDEQSQVRATMAGALKLVLSQRLLPRTDGQGMVAAYEMITGKLPLWSLIRDNKLFQLSSLLQRGRAYGMIRLEDSLRELLERGIISEEEARLHADDPRALAPQAAPSAPPQSRGLFGRGQR